MSSLPQQPSRDLRLDLVRGVTMLIIFIAHVPNNLWADYIPARMGFSSGAEIFVLCSGIASGLAIGGTFVRKGFGAGSRRILRRIGQLYAAHLALLLILGGLALTIDALNGSSALAIRYDLKPLLDAPLRTLLAYATLQYVPAFFDILPLYIVLLAMVPVAMLFTRHRYHILAVSIGLWLGVLTTRIGPPNEASGTVWYFNPLAWQLLFLLGFGWARGWWPVPRPNRPWLLLAAAAFLIASFPLTFWAINDGTRPLLSTIQTAIYPPDAITVLHPTRLLHALALGYLVLSALEFGARHLDHRILRPLIAVGQNSFPTFLAGLGLSMLGGIAIDHAGMGHAVAAAINLSGVLILCLLGLWLQKQPTAAQLQRQSDFLKSGLIARES